MKRITLSVTLSLSLCGLAWAQAPTPAQPLPALVIEDRGELVLENEEFSYRTWRSDTRPGSVHVLQYIAGTMGDSKTFSPLTDRLIEEFGRNGFHVTTVINLDAALWGTSGFVVSEVKSSKREFPGSTLVLDEDGLGAKTWQLGKQRNMLLIMDPAGIVHYRASQPLSETEIDAQVEWIRGYIDSPIASTSQR